MDFPYPPWRNHCWWSIRRSLSFGSWCRRTWNNWRCWWCWSNSLGFDVNNEPFEKNSWYFRNALVRANYTNMNKGIYMNTEYLEKFFRNLLLGESNELRNRYWHIKYNEKVAINEKSSDIILNYLKENDSINNSTAREITGLTAPAVRKIFKKLEAEGLIVGTGENKNRTYSLKRYGRRDNNPG